MARRRYGTATVGNMEPTVQATVTAGRRGAKSGASKEIGPGTCGFLRCKRERVGGNWYEGGSYMCKRHQKRLIQVRALWDKTSPQALEVRKQIDVERELRELKAEERKAV